MTRKAPAALLAALLISACSQATPEQQIVNDAAEALGGRDQVLAANTLVMEGEGSQGNMGQDVTMDATGQTFSLTEYRRAVDLAGGRARTEQTRTPNFPYFQGQQPQRQIAGVDGAVAYNVGGNGMAARASNQVAEDRRVELYHHPLAIVRAALDPMAAVANARTEGGESLVDVTVDGAMLTLAIDATTKLPTRVRSTAYNTNLGDVIVETTFADYQDVNGLQLPTRLTTRTDRFLTNDITVANQTVNGDTGDLAAPEAAASAAEVTGVPPANVTVEQLSPGVWLLGGQSHHSVLVEFADHLELIEAPQNDTRALAVIAKARETVPGKPLTHLINTHHHFDHSGGIRAAIAEGLTIVTHEDNAAYYQEAGTRPHTVSPDALQQNARPVTVEPVTGGQMERSDGQMTMQLFWVEGNPHASTMLMAYFPATRMLVEVDVFTPGAAVAPFAPNLLENIERRNLRVDRIVPLHGQEAPFTALRDAVAGSAGN